MSFFLVDEKETPITVRVLSAMATPDSGRRERRIRTAARTIMITVIIMAGSRDSLAASAFSEGAAGRRHYVKRTTFL